MPTFLFSNAWKTSEEANYVHNEIYSEDSVSHSIKCIIIFSNSKIVFFSVGSAFMLK